MDSIFTYSRSELADIVQTLGEPRFRSQQLYQWLYQKHVASFDDMSNLSKVLRRQLSETYSFERPFIAQTDISIDGTRKYIISLGDGSCVESVAIPTYSRNGKVERLTVCISSQVGCPMACRFCATGEEGFSRNLNIGEIVDQVLLVQENFGERVTNIVMMGQGEPFLNYDNVLEALRICNDAKGLGIGARHIALSTCGVIPGIEKFSQISEQFTLAVSLHSAIQTTRDKLMPRVHNYPLRELKSALEQYIEKTNRRITFEYLMLDKVNSDDESLKALIQFCDGLLCHVNLLPMNEVDSSHLKPAKKQVIDQWLQKLESSHIEATLRTSRGADIAGACGQLKETYLRQ